MTLLSLHRATDDNALLRRTRRGDRRARRILIRRHAQRAVELVDLMVGEGYDLAPLATRALDVALDGTGSLDDALVRATVRVCAPLSEDFSRLVLVLTDLEAWSEEAVADLLDIAIADVSELRAAARAAAGVSSTVRADCRGWRLVVTRERATEHERNAGEAHLALCRSCRRRDLEQRETRDRLGARSAAASAVVAADVVALAVPVGGAASAAGIAGAIFGKAGVAGVGAAAVAVTIASAGVAAARHHPSAPHRQGPTTRPAATSPSAPTATSSAPAAGPATAAPAATAGTPTTSRSQPLPLPPLPSLPSSTLPTLSGATSLLPLPTATATTLVPLPALSPTTVPSLLSPLPSVPLPTVSVPSTGSLLGH
jgi:hypothetical protein